MATATVPALPSAGEINRAIDTVEDSRRTHVHWAEWRRQGHNDNPMAGDLNDHLEAIAGYDQVLDVLRRMREAAR